MLLRGLEDMQLDAAGVSLWKTAFGWRIGMRICRDAATDAAKEAAKIHPSFRGILEISSRNEQLPLAMSEAWTAARLLDIAILIGNVEAATQLGQDLPSSAAPEVEWNRSSLLVLCPGGPPFLRHFLQAQTLKASTGEATMQDGAGSSASPSHSLGRGAGAVGADGAVLPSKEESVVNLRHETGPLLSRG